MIRGKREDTEGVREAEFIVLDFIKSTPNATVPEIARLIDDVGADVDYIANVIGVDQAVARQAYNEVINGAPPIEQVIEKQAASDPIVPPITPLKDVIDTSGATGAVASGNPLASATQTQAARAREQERIAAIEAENARLAQVEADRAAAAQRGAEARATAAAALRGQIADQGAAGVISGLTSDGTSERIALMNLSTNTGIPVTELERTFQTTPEPPPAGATLTPTPGATVTAPGATVTAPGATTTTVPDATDPNLRRDIRTGAMAGAQLPVGLAAAERAALGGAGTAAGLLGTTAGAAGRELTAGTMGGIGALRGGIGQARQDIMQGTQTGISALQQALGGARADIESGFQRAEGMFDPYAQAGGQALQQQLALSGALGPEAFQQAYQESPQMQFLREQGERAALRTAAARGGLGGGRVMQELARYGTGLASQDLQNQIANLQALSAQGLGARGSAANIATGGAQQLANLGVLGGTAGLQAATQQGTELANLAQQLGVRESDLLTALGAGRSNIALGIGTRAADLAAQTGLNVAGMRTRAGEQLAGQFGTAASQLANLQREQGLGTQGLIAGQADLISRLQQSAAAGDAAAQTELAQLQAQGYSNIGTNLAGVPQAPTFVGQSPIVGALGGAVVGSQLAEMFPQQQQQVQTPTQTGGTFQIGSYFPQGYFAQPTTAPSGATVYPGNMQFGGNVSSTGILRSPISLGFS